MASNLKNKLFYYALSMDFLMFVEKCYNEIGGGQKFAKTIAIELIVDKLLEIQNDKIMRSIINVPPRTLKSTIVSIAFTAWLLGQDPKLKILCISYGEDLAKDFSIKVRQIMKSTWYKKIFSTRFSANGQRDDYLETTNGGFRRAISIDGSITGYGADIIIIDDPQKATDVLSEQIRNKTNAIFSNTIISRLNNKITGKIILVAQRLHPDDFSSYVQKYETWDVLKIPAIAKQDIEYKLSNKKTIIYKNGSVINPDIEPLDKLLKIEQAMGEFNFCAQYQQEPISPKGNIIKIDDFKYFNFKQINGDKTVIQSWDCAQKTGENNDFSVCVTAIISNDIVYVIDITKYKLDFPDLLDEIKNMQIATNANEIIIEDQGIGAGLISQLEREGYSPISFKPKDSKAVRAQCVTDLIRRGKVRLLQGAFWLNDFTDEVRAFPHGAHDDQIDALVQLLSLFKDGVFSSSIGDLVIDRFDEYCHYQSTEQIANTYIDQLLDDMHNI